MKKITDPLFAAFSAYSTVPVPSVGWDKRSLSYVFCFFPLVGVLIGALEIGWHSAAEFFGLNVLFYASIAAVLPVFVSGGIHIDGYIDTCDAAMTFGNHEKKHNVLKDPRAGAFGVIYAITYFILLTGIFAQFYEKGGNTLLLFLSFILSRAFGGIASLTVSPSPFSGMLKIFTSNSTKYKTKIILYGYVVICFALIFYFISYIIFFAVAVAAIVHFLLFHRFCIRHFGGISGDLAGFYIVTAEALLLLLAAVGGAAV